MHDLLLMLNVVICTVSSVGISAYLFYSWGYHAGQQSTNPDQPGQEAH